MDENQSDMINRLVYYWLCRLELCGARAFLFIYVVSFFFFRMSFSIFDVLGYRCVCCFARKCKYNLSHFLLTAYLYIISSNIRSNSLTKWMFGMKIGPSNGICLIRMYISTSDVFSAYASRCCFWGFYQGTRC